MSRSVPSTDDRAAFHELCAAIEADLDRGGWSEASQRLKDWAATARGTLPHEADRQRLTALGIALLVQGDPANGRGLAAAFRPAGGAAIEALHGLLTDAAQHFEARWFAGQILAKLRHLDAMTRLVTTLDADDEMTVSIAIDALGHFGQAEIELVTRELERLPPERTQVRQSLIRALTQASDPAIIAPLLAVVGDPDPAIRLMAIGALSAFDDDRVVAVLREALQDTSAPIRKVALSGLGAKAQYWQQYSPAKPTATIDWLDCFKPLTLDLNPEVATQATIAIGRLATPAATRVLLDLLRSPLTPLPQAIASARALLQSADIESIAALMGVCTLAPDRLPVTLEAVRGLGRLRDRTPEVGLLLADWCRLRFGSPEADRAAAISLAHCDPNLLQAIAYSFSTLRSPAARPWLMHLSDDPRERVRIAATAALNKLT